MTSTDSLVIPTEGHEIAEARGSLRRVDMAFEAQRAKVFQERMVVARKEMERLREGIHPDYLLGSTVLLEQKERRLMLAERCRQQMIDQGEAICTMEEKHAKQEYQECLQEAQAQMRAKLESDLEAAEKEHKEMSLSGDAIPFRDDAGLSRMPRQGLRNKRPRGDQGSTVLIKQRKTTSLLAKPIVSNLTDYIVDQDLKNIKNILKQSRGSKSGKPVGVAPPEIFSDSVEAEYLDGALFYDKQKFHVGDNILVENETSGRYPAAITAINASDMWLRRDGCRARLHFANLRVGKYKIRKHTLANWSKIGTKPGRST